MKDSIDRILSGYRQYLVDYGIDTESDNKLLVEWDALIMCFYIALPLELKKKYRDNGGFMETLLSDMEEFLKYCYLREQEGRDGKIVISGYTLHPKSEAVSCFSVYSLFLYSFMEPSEKRDSFYKTMIVYPFCYECVQGVLTAEDCGKLMEKMDIHLRYCGETFNRSKFAQEKNGKMIEKTVDMFIRENHYNDTSMKQMEIDLFRSHITEASFLFEEGGVRR